MKHLKTYKLFESETSFGRVSSDPTWKSEEEMNQDIDSIKSMLGDISDSGCNVEVKKEEAYFASTLSILINKTSDTLKEGLSTWGNIKNNIYQTLDAMSDKYELIKIEMYLYSNKKNNPHYELFLYSIDELRKADGEDLKDNTKIVDVVIILSLK